ncbi:putative phage abortive infection protein [Pseudomonas atacamensis]
MTEGTEANENKITGNFIDDFMDRVTPSRLAIFGFTICSLVVIGVFSHFFLGLDIPFIAISNWESAQYWGQLGDFLGGVLNPVLSFLALIAVVISLKSQTKDVRQARLDSESANARIDEQTRIFQHQNFEIAFFSLIEIHQKNYERVTAPDNDNYREGRNEFDKIVNYYNLERIDAGKDLSQVQIFGGTEYQEKQVTQCAKSFMAEVGRTMIHYFKSLEEIIKYIDGPSRPADVLPEQYLSIFKSLLSPEEVECLVMYALSDEGEFIKPFMTQYGLLELLPRRNRSDLAKQLLNI